MPDNVKVHKIDLDDLSQLPENIRDGIINAINGREGKNAQTTIACLASSFFMALLKNENSCLGELNKKPAQAAKDLTDIAIAASLPMNDDINFKSEKNNAAPAICLASAIVSGLKLAANIKIDKSNFEKAVLIRTNAERIVDLYCSGKIEHDMYANAALEFLGKCIQAAYKNTLDGYNSHLAALAKGLHSVCCEFTYETVKKLWLENESIDISKITSVDMPILDSDLKNLPLQTYAKAKDVLIDICESLWLNESIYLEKSFMRLISATAEKISRVMHYVILEKSTYGISMAGQHMSNKLIRDGSVFISSRISKADAEYAFGQALNDMAGNEDTGLDMQLAKNTANTFMNNAFHDITASVDSKASKNSKVMTKFADEFPDRLYEILCPHAAALSEKRFVPSDKGNSKEFSAYVNKIYGKGKNINV